MAPPFQKMVLIAFGVALVTILVFIGVSAGYSKDEQWPPVVADCPDYWLLRGATDSESQKCVNVKDLGTCPAASGKKHAEMDFTKYPFNESNDLCAKYKWATKCGIPWDGITYGVENPCDADQEVV